MRRLEPVLRADQPSSERKLSVPERLQFGSEVLADPRLQLRAIVRIAGVEYLTGPMNPGDQVTAVVRKGDPQVDRRAGQPLRDRGVQLGDARPGPGRHEDGVRPGPLEPQKR